MKILLSLIFICTFIFADVAKISAIRGDAFLFRDGNSIVLKLGTVVKKSDVIETKRNSKLQIIFKDNTTITVGRSSKIDISDYVFDEENKTNSKTDFNLIKGAFKVITGKIGKINKEKFKLRVKNSTIGIRGTNFIVRLEEQGFNVTVVDGGVYVTHPKAPEQRVFVSKNETAKVENGEIKVFETSKAEGKEANDSLEPEEEEEDNNENSNDEGTSTSGNDSNDNNPSNEDDEQSSSGSENSEDSSGTTQVDENSTSDDTTTSSSTSTSNTSGTTSSALNTAQIVQNDNTNTSTTYDLSGYFLGSYFAGTSANQSFTHQNTSFSAKRVDNLFSFDQVVERKIGTNTENQSVSGESTVSISGTTSPQKLNDIAFNYTATDPNHSGNYTVYTDSLGEVFVGYYDGVADTGTTGGATTGGTTTATGTNAEFNELFVAGTNTNINNLDKTKIYIYKDFASMQVNKDSTGNITKSKLQLNEGGFEYYNPYLDSSMHLSQDFFAQGAEEFILGNSTTMKSHRNKYNYNYTAAAGTNLNNISTGTITANVALKGSNGQALVYNVDGTSTTTDYSSTTPTTSTSSSLNTGVSYEVTNTSTSVKNSGSYSLTGYVVGEVYGNTINRAGEKSLTLNVNRNTGAITGSATLGSAAGTTDQANLSFDGNLAAFTSYYISDDNFGVMAQTAGSTTDSYYDLSSTKYALTSNSGYLMALPDGGFDSNDNPIMLDDDSSWGYWTAKFEDGTNQVFIDPRSTWVAGIKTAQAVVNSDMLNNPGTYSFKGNVIGSVLTASGNVESILLDGNVTNEVTLNFNIGSTTNTVSGAMAFKTLNTNQVDYTLSGTNVTDTGFDGTMTGFAGSFFKGEYYGDTSVKSVGGEFNVTDSSNNKAQGVFKAKRQ